MSKAGSYQTAPTSDTSHRPQVFPASEWLAKSGARLWKQRPPLWILSSARTGHRIRENNGLTMTIYDNKWAPLVAQLVKNLPAMRKTWVRSLGREDSLEKGMGLCTTVFWPGGFHGLYSPWGHRESDTTERLPLSLSFIIKDLLSQ